MRAGEFGFRFSGKGKTSCTRAKGLAPDGSSMPTSTLELGEEVGVGPPGGADGPADGDSSEG